jgi:hypothetical protein
MTGALEEFLRRKELVSNLLNVFNRNIGFIRRYSGKPDCFAKDFAIEIKTAEPIWCQIGQPLVNKNDVDFSWLQNKDYMESLKKFGEQFGKQLIQGWHD